MGIRELMKFAELAVVIPVLIMQIGFYAGLVIFFMLFPFSVYANVKLQYLNYVRVNDKLQSV